MKRFLPATALAMATLLTTSSFAQAPAGAPAGSTGLCNDGTYYSGATKQGACRGHQGVKDWYGPATPASTAAPAAATAAPKKAAAVAAAPAAAKAPAAAPAGSTGLCNDGTYYSGATKQGACRGHQGVKDWYGAATAATAAAATAKAPAPVAPVAAPVPAPASAVPAPAAASRATPAPAAPAASAGKAANTPAAVAAPGGGPGLVWANAGTKVYHCQGDRWYGKTKEGQYMSEADAAAKGFKPDHGKACGK